MLFFVLFSCSKLHVFLWTQLLGMSREFRRGTHALKIFYRQHFNSRHFLEVRKLNLGAWKLLPLSRNPGEEISWGARSRLESKEAAQVWDGGVWNVSSDPVAFADLWEFFYFYLLMGAQPRPGGCAGTSGGSKSFGAHPPELWVSCRVVQLPWNLSVPTPQG